MYARVYVGPVQSEDVSVCVSLAYEDRGTQGPALPEASTKATSAPRGREASRAPSRAKERAKGRGDGAPSRLPGEPHVDMPCTRMPTQAPAATSAMAHTAAAG